MNTKKTITLGAIAIVTALSLSACSNSVQEAEPVGIGSSINQLHKSPCACNQIKMKLPAWLHEIPSTENA